MYKYTQRLYDDAGQINPNNIVSDAHLLNWISRDFDEWNEFVFSHSMICCIHIYWSDSNKRMLFQLRTNKKNVYNTATRNE